MDLTAAIERLERVVAVRADAAAVCDDLSAALCASNELRSFLAAADADLSRRLAASSSFPEAAIAETTRGSHVDASKALDRSRTLEAVPSLADALDDAAITPGHVDAVTRGAKGLDPSQRDELYDRVGSLIDVASHATVEQFGRRIRREIERITRDHAMERLDRQRRAARLSSWVDVEGMWNVRGRFDPVTGVRLSAALDRATEALFAEATPDTCPADPIEKQKHLRAHALARLLDGTAGAGRPGRPEFVAVIDVSADGGASSAHDAHGGHGRSSSSNADGSPGEQRCPTDRRGEPAHPDRAGRPGHDRDGLADLGASPRVSWPLPIEVPVPILAELVADATVTSVVVRDGVVLHAPGRLDLGRSTRLANAAQRRALRALHRTCAVPGCPTSYDRCELHHVRWWRHGGRTDLANLLPICVRHHHAVHEGGWELSLDRQRRLTISFPDGSVRSTGPPSRADLSPTEEGFTPPAVAKVRCDERSAPGAPGDERGAA